MIWFLSGPEVRPDPRRPLLIPHRRVPQPSHIEWQPDALDRPATHWSRLSPAEEMLIAKAHVFVEVRHSRGISHNYRGHVVSFQSHAGKVYPMLSLSPSELDIVVIRPASIRESIGSFNPTNILSFTLPRRNPRLQVCSFGPRRDQLSSWTILRLG